MKENGVEETWSASKETLAGWGMTEKAVSDFEVARRRFDPAGARALLDTLDQCFIPVGAPSYPDELLHLEAPPAGLFVRGPAQALDILNAIPRMTVVGTRKASGEGVAAAKTFTRELSGRGIAVVSGMALGIDGQAHSAALETGGLTVAVLGCGADVIYPPRHKWLHDKIARSGVIVSELPPRAHPTKWTFPRRNRLLAALGDAVLVVEGAHTSGALQTARWALELGRAVYAVPNSIFRASSEGCNALIYDGAKPALKPDLLVEDFLRATRIERGARESAGALRTAVGERVRIPGVDADDSRGSLVLEALKAGPASVDRLVLLTGLTAREVCSALGELEVVAAVERAGPGTYLRAP
jgi:DNA processing protein